MLVNVNLFSDENPRVAGLRRYGLANVLKHGLNDVEKAHY